MRGIRPVCFTHLLSFLSLLLTHWLKGCWADRPAEAVRNRTAGRGKCKELKLLLLYSSHATYGCQQMTEPRRCVKQTGLRGMYGCGLWRPHAILCDKSQMGCSCTFLTDHLFILHLLGWSSRSASVNTNSQIPTWTESTATFPFFSTLASSSSSPSSSSLSAD